MAQSGEWKLLRNIGCGWNPHSQAPARLRFCSKIEAIREELKNGDRSFAAVILIGMNENEPLTVLDGNHRLIASMLGASRDIRKLRFLCGLSPRMSECCWYNSNLVTLLRYGRNVLTHAIRNPEAELARLLRNAG